MTSDMQNNFFSSPPSLRNPAIATVAVVGDTIPAHVQWAAKILNFDVLSTAWPVTETQDADIIWLPYSPPTKCSADQLEVLRQAIIIDVEADHINDLWIMVDGIPHVSIVSNPDNSETAYALCRALELDGTRVHDSVEDKHMAQLSRLQEDVARVTRMISALSQSQANALVGGYSTQVPRQADSVSDAQRGFRHHPVFVQPENKHPVTAQDVRRIMRLRRMREEFFSPELFADPAWDMMLDLYAAQIDGQRVSVSSLCIASAVPATTALRWIKSLTDNGLLQRSADPRDGRRVFVEMTDHTLAAMDRYFAAIAQESALI